MRRRRRKKIFLFSVSSRDNGVECRLIFAKKKKSTEKFQSIARLSMDAVASFAWRQLLIDLACMFGYTFFIWAWGRTTSWIREVRGAILLGIPLLLWVSRVVAFVDPDNGFEYGTFNVVMIIVAMGVTMSIDSHMSDSIPGHPGLPTGDGLPGAFLLIGIAAFLSLMCISF